MKFYSSLFLLFVMICPFCVNGQQKVVDYKFPQLGKMDTVRVAGTVEGGEMIPWISITEVTIVGEGRKRTPEEQAAYNRLRYNVLKVMPYALFAKRRYEQLEREVAVESNKKKQKELVKQCDKEIKDLFNREIKELTITQGKILTKLVDREVGKSTYDIIKESRGGFTAFVYQSVARVVGHNLKATYSATEDRDIEAIIASSGYYNGGRN